MYLIDKTLYHAIENKTDFIENWVKLPKHYN